jgi:arylformamidase
MAHDEWNNSEILMPEKGPAIFLDYDQTALDAAYDQAAYAPYREQLISRRSRDREIGASTHRRARARRLWFRRERLDIYRARRKLAPVFIFIHGGAWRSARSKDFAGPAKMFLAAGAHYVVPDFAWVQDVGGNLMGLADQVCRAVAWVYRNASRFDGDPNRLYIGANPLVGISPRSR